MSFMRVLMSRCASVFRREQLDRELDDELRSHLEMAMDENQRRGMSGEDARRAAIRDFGGVTQVREKLRMREGLPWLEEVRRDIGYALRQMRKSPGFATVVILTLALGIGANATVFSVLNAVLLRPLAFPEANRLVRILSVKEGVRVGPSAPDMRDFAAQNRSFEKLAVYDQWRKNVSTTQYGNNAEGLNVGLASQEFFEALGVQPVLGRLFTPQEGLAGRDHVALITEAFWQSHYQRDPQVLGRTLSINDEPYVIVGVVPATIPGWLHGAQVQPPVWEPFLPTPDVWSDQSRGGRGYGAVGLLKPGVSLQQAQQDLAAIARNLDRSYPIDHGFGVVVEPLADARAGDLRPLLLVLMGAVALILLIACSNLAALLLARNTARQREFAMRQALGGGRAALVRQVLAETLMFSLFGSGLGLAMSWMTTRALRLEDPAKIPQLVDLTLDWRVLVFTLAAGLGTCLLFGLAPAVLSTRVDVARAMNSGGRSSSGSSRQWFRKMLVTAQIALSLMLLVGAGLLIQTLLRLQNQDLGFRVDHLMRAHFYLPPAQYSSPELITRFCDRYTDGLRQVPGIRDVSVTTIYPPSERWPMMFSIEGKPVSKIEDVPTVQFGVVDANYLPTTGIPVMRGRNFSESDREQTLPVAIVNEAFVRTYLPDEDPIGRRVEVGAPSNMIPRDVWMGTQRTQVTIAGVMRDTKDQGLAEPVAPQLITLFRQMPTVNYGFKDVLVRSQLPPEALRRSLEQQVHAFDPRVPLTEVQSMSEYLDDLTAVKRFTSEILACFAGLGLVLAVMGIYGVISFLVAQRTQEIGIRLALGAPRMMVLWLVSAQGLRMTLVGVAIGLVGAVLAARSMASLLFGISSLDLFTLISCSLTLVVIALLASAVPARRAAAIDPMRALRTE
jgi:predicted permease